MYFFFILLWSYLNTVQSKRKRIKDNTKDVTWDIYECPRNRRAWHLLSPTERAEYADVIKQLNNNGKREIFTKTYYELTDAMQAHFTSAFYPWHRYFLFSFENEVRKLDVKYKCWALPYWDITHEASRESNPFILKSGVGGNAKNDGSQNYCIFDNEWTSDKYPLNNLCADDENGKQCCLKRKLNTDFDLVSAARLAYQIRYGKTTFGTSDLQNSWSWYTSNILHNNAHIYIGEYREGFLTPLTSFYAPDDPIFYLLHSWLDYLWTVWMNCHGYNNIHENDIQLHASAYNLYSNLQQSIP